MSDQQQCKCDICKLANQLNTIVPNCTSEQRIALEELWTRMESAETALDEIIALAQEGEELRIAGRIYRAQDETPIQQVLRGEPGNN